MPRRRGLLEEEYLADPAPPPVRGLLYPEEPAETIRLPPLPRRAEPSMPPPAHSARVPPPPSGGFFGELRRAWEPELNTLYGSVLPFARELETGELRLAAPSFVRDTALGAIDLVNGVNTGAVSPEATMTLLGGALSGGSASPTTLAAIRGPGRPPRRPVSRAETPEIRHNPGHDPVSPTAPNVAPIPAGAPGPPAGSNASAFPAVDPEGRHLTAPWRSGRTSDGTTFLGLPEGARRDLLDYVAQGGVARDIPRGEMRGYLGEYSVRSPVWFGSGERTAQMASARIRAGEPRGGATEMHEVGHDIHRMQTGDARVPAVVMGELGRYFPTGGKRPGSAAYRNELYAEGLSAYLRNPEFMHSRAPNAAAMYRRHVNEDPYLSRYFQLQQGATPGVALPPVSREGAAE